MSVLDFQVWIHLDDSLKFEFLSVSIDKKFFKRKGNSRFWYQPFSECSLYVSLKGRNCSEACLKRLDRNTVPFGARPH